MQPSTAVPTPQLILEQIISILSTISVSDILDILIAAFFVYKLITVMSNTRSGQLIKGVLAILILFSLAIILNLKMLDAILRLLITYGAFALVIIFQPELRSILEKLGRSSIGSIHLLPQNHEQADAKKARTKVLINSVCDAVSSMASKKVGALIVLERMTKLGEIAATGTTIDATPSSELIENIFFHNSPLHDGALIISEDRLYAAGCYLPLSQNYDINRSFGTRHRAALGLSESSDALVVVVSEETGFISLVIDGIINSDVTEAKLKTTMYRALIPMDETRQNNSLPVIGTWFKRREGKAAKK